MTNKAIDIGFLEEKSNWLLHPRFFPSKVGGKPAWLDLKNLPNPSELTCKRCNDPLIFLCQVYSPYEEKDECFHRTIFIFICKKGSCCQANDSDNFLVLRCQIPRKNDYYSFGPNEADVDEQTDPPNSNFVVTEGAKSLLFKEWELMVDEEDEEDPTTVDTNQEMEKLRKMIAEKKAGTMENLSEKELEQYTGSMPEDKVFNKFSKRIARHPDQVLRYDRGGIPLWITTNTGNSPIPNCKYCNGERHFEFQIMPQVLNFINVEIEFNSIDWGVLAVYTCKESCNEGPAYKEEFLIKQDLTT
ncbi:unnamed protein product [Danaus chrysippus]|uniref:(African queen) hypothetical protein n=1 Tax=Danaus chrysippus TaxID=151541 RepID=A0A8J2VWG5_9NEOP|nr:unnamed protein product [Danaus chrysippus]